MGDAASLWYRTRAELKRRLCVGVVFVGAALLACGPSREGFTPPPDGYVGAGGSDLFDAGATTGPPAADAGGLCGNQIHQIVTAAPNIYFVLDASGSMAESVGTSTRYERVRFAAIDMVRRLGPLINVGAALFPLDATNSDACHVGGEVLSLRPGDPVSDKLGPTAFAFSEATIVKPSGGTPTTATLEVLLPKLSAAKGKTILVLATDGAPNCNPNVSCGGSAPESCLDRQQAIMAVSAFAEAGVQVYVVGIPGSEGAADVLDELALAGGAPQLAPPFYYKVGDFDDLGAVLGSIAARVISCEFDLVQPPPDEGYTNVYLDQKVLPYDSVDGWIWKAPSVIELVGEACQKLKNGQVRQVQIVSGCPTEATK